MEDADSAAIVNREDAIPVLRIPSRTRQPSNASSSEETITKTGRRDRVLESAAKIKGKLNELNSPSAPSIQDRLFSSLMAQMIPPEELSENDDEDGSPHKKKDRRSRTYVDRPNFSVTLMSSNFRRFNSRIGIIFVFQNRLIHLFTWRHPTSTLSFLVLYTLLCLNPHLLPLIPLVATLFMIMLPSFLARHPPSANAEYSGFAAFGPPIAPPSRVRPAPELSKDFFRNMRDLQNCMEDFSRLHDAANEYVTPYTNFSDEPTSSTVYLVLFILANAAFVASHVVPWRAVALIAGWLAVGSCHPKAQDILLSAENLGSASDWLDTIQYHLRAWMDNDIILDEPAETRQVEIFELQRHQATSGEWEAWLFSPSPYDPLSPARIAGSRATGTQFFEDVQPPRGWVWKDKKWNLDMASREWVEARMVTGVEVETEGERWVYDMPAEDLAPSNGSPSKKRKGREAPRSGWEEGSGVRADKRGLWRRRRWVRDVERVVVKPHLLYQGTMAALALLPPELVEKIFADEEVQFEDIVAATRVSKYTRNVISGSTTIRKSVWLEDCDRPDFLHLPNFLLYRLLNAYGAPKADGFTLLTLYHFHLSPSTGRMSKAEHVITCRHGLQLVDIYDNLRRFLGNGTVRRVDILRQFKITTPGGVKGYSWTPT